MDDQPNELTDPMNDQPKELIYSETFPATTTTSGMKSFLPSHASISSGDCAKEKVSLRLMTTEVCFCFGLVDPIPIEL